MMCKAQTHIRDSSGLMLGGAIPGLAGLGVFGSR
jgi:hypothetical protein